MKKRTLLSYLLIACIAANILLPGLPVTPPEPDGTATPLNDVWVINKN